MEIRKSKVLGFCFGVRRAVGMIEAEVKEQGPLATLGPVVHNPHVVQELANKGAKVIKSLAEADGAVAITAHGVGEEVYEAIFKKGLRLVDTTCPIVRKAQKVAHQLVNSGFKVIIYGEEDHPEVKGILGWTKGQGLAILDPQTPVEITRRKVAIISQTTKGQEAFVQFVAEFLAKNFARLNEVRIINTTCPETGQRYAAAKDLANSADLIIVVGGKNSANTRKLAETCAKLVETYHVEDASQIQPSWLWGKKHIGVTAGASTPDAAIDAVIKRLQQLGESNSLKVESPKVTGH